MKKIKIFGFCLLCLATTLLIGNQFNGSSKIIKVLKTFPKDEREVLELFFFELNRSGSAYVLFGNKPMSICSFMELDDSRRDPLTSILDLSWKLRLSNLRMNRGLEVWKKYKHLFTSSKFFLLENREQDWVTMVTIHKRNFLKKVEEHIDLFKAVLGTHMTPVILLKQCLNSDNIIGNVLKNNDALLGILLGFGRHNAQLFSRRTQIEEGKEFRRIPLTNKPLTPSHGFSTLEEERQHINGVLRRFSECDTCDCNSLCFAWPGFMVDPNHPETQQLRKEYKKQCEKIIDKYKKGDFLEVTLKQFFGCINISGCFGIVCFEKFYFENKE